MNIRLHGIGRRMLCASAGALLAWAGTDTLSAQPPFTVEAVQEPVAPREAAPSIRRYLNKRAFRLPIQVAEQSRALIREIHLYVKEQASEPWKMCGVVAPDQQEFEYLAKRDGEYSFTMVTVDTQGRGVPADVRNEPPGIIVVIDTQPPQLDLSNLGTSPEGQLFKFEVRDANVNRAKTGFFYQGGDKQFRPLEEVPGRPNVYCVPGRVIFTGLLRATAEDLASNVSTNEIHVSQISPQKSATAKPPPAVEPAAAERTPMEPAKAPGVSELPKPLPTPQELTPMEQPKSPGVSGLPKPLPKEVVTAVPLLEPSAPERKTPAPSIDGGTKQVTYLRPGADEGPRFMDDTPNPAFTPPSPPVQPPPVHPTTTTRKDLPKRQFVNQSKVMLEYEIENVGQSGVGRVEVWLTRDDGKTWKKHCEDTQRKNAAEVHFPEDGLFGVTLVVTNGRGAGVVPVAGDRPEWVIEVDTTKPSAQLTNVETVHENGAVSVQITWSAKDKNLGETPVDLHYGVTAQGPWTPIAKGLKSEGQHRWTPPSSIGAHAFVRLTVSDLAGNTTTAGTLEPVQLEDPARPRGVIRAIRMEPTSAN